MSTLEKMNFLTMPLRIRLGESGSDRNEWMRKFDAYVIALAMPHELAIHLKYHLLNCCTDLLHAPDAPTNLVASCGISVREIIHAAYPEACCFEIHCQYMVRSSPGPDSKLLALSYSMEKAWNSAAEFVIISTIESFLEGAVS